MAINLFFKSEVRSQEQFDVTDLPNNILQKFYEEWKKIKGDKFLPDKSDVDVHTLSSVYDYIAFVHTDENPFRPRYSIVGKRLELLLGQKLEHKYVDEVFTECILTEALKSYKHICHTRKPMYTRKSWNTLIRTVGYDRLLLPLTDGGEDVELILGCFTPIDQNIIEVSDWRNAEDIKPILMMLDLDDAKIEGYELELED